MRIRRFNEAGIDRFRTELQRLRESPQSALNEKILEDDALTETLPGDSRIEPRVLSTKREAAEYLTPLLEQTGLGRTALMNDRGLWTWLTALYFDSACKETTKGRRPLDDANYVPDAGGRRTAHRHRLRTACRVFLEVPEPRRILLDRPLHDQSNVFEDLVWRTFILKYPSLLRVVDTLYFDPTRGGPRRGAFARHRVTPGDFLNRFVSRIKQASRILDVPRLSETQLLELLGSEFEPWRQSSTPESKN